MCLYVAACLLTLLLIVLSFAINPLLGIVTLIAGAAVAWEMAKDL